ncbi:DUF3301 domain-containing protein [Thioflexithrix psekupsensis]|uniref:DUF3301 domain-containing protein n=1 Tax=Thioflexithrix psekupsensis TaxID=1570016 RepID=A0A251X3C6_9GAMM|nr:DUF3301 domain-containing protein [Thioflexithrix psekupsensis]OUD11743.1 hypothetical protein TPSD3_16985 [Thioflexithrix psekupsensis]
MTWVMLAILLGFAWFWFDSLRAREQVIYLARHLCQQYDLQLLDQTVSLQRLSLKREGFGQIKWLRHYQFEFSSDGANRLKGTVILYGREPQLFELEGYLNRTIMNQ